MKNKRSSPVVVVSLFLRGKRKNAMLRGAVLINVHRRDLWSNDQDPYRTTISYQTN
jgi:hypothetical protein